MANPKYADLPGIAANQPDVYETNDLPESEQGNLSIADAIIDQCDSVETIKISSSEAFNKFKGKTLDGRELDFTDSTGRNRKYDARSGEWEMMGNHSKENETPIQACNRIQFEVKQLFEKVNSIKDNAEKESSDIPPVVLLQKVEQLQEQLQNLHMEKMLGSEALADMSDPLGSLHKKLLTQLNSFKSASAPVKKEKVAQSSSSECPKNAVKYELYVKPDQAKLENSSKVAALEQRIKNLENIIGQEKKINSFLTSNTDGKSIIDAISVLSSKLNLLDHSYLEQTENRLVVLQQCLQQVTEKKQQIEETEKQSKVAELYDLLKKVDDLSADVPQVVERLVSLKDLHEQALQFSKALTQLDTTQQQIVNSLRSNEKALKEVHTTFAKNTEMIETNISSLNARISSLK